MTAQAPKFCHGNLVRRRNRPDERGTVQGAPRCFGGTYYYKVIFDGSPTPVDVAESDIEEFVLGQSVEDLLAARAFAEKVTLSRLITFERLDTPLSDNIYALRASRTRFEPYQFKPLLKFLRSPNQRLLLADEVGLGKTIEAGFILSEMVARHPLTFRRALIVCKASLCTKWQMEMKRRFDLYFEVWKASRLLQFLGEYEEDPDIELKAICSLESFRSREVMDRWEKNPVPLDILIIDEAHHLKNTATLSHQACRQAAENADAVLLLTATPIQIGARDLFNLLFLLDPEQFSSFEYFQACMKVNETIVEAERLVTGSDPARFRRIRELLAELECHPVLDAAVAVRRQLAGRPIFRETLHRLETADPRSRKDTVELHRLLTELNFLSGIVTRTKRRDVKIGATREARVVRVNLSAAEIAFYKAVVDYVRGQYRAHNYDGGLLFGLMMPQRQVASCIPAMVEYYREKLGGFEAGGLETEESDFDRGDWEQADASWAPLPESDLLDVIRRWYVEGRPDSKFEALLQSLKELDQAQPGEPVVIFSYFRKTLEYLSRRLTACGYSNRVISGAVPPEEREQRIADFRRGKFRILLSSEVGSEGLDFQFCHIMFNYDLPWNPMVVEQRIGRLDRFGQCAEKIQIFTLSAPGTIEDAILERLYARIRIFESYIGDLETILGETVNALTRDLFDPRLTERQRLERLEREGLNLERKKLQLEELERESARFVGQDEFYLQEIKRVEELGRYISAADLQVLVEEFLTRYDARSALVRTAKPEVFVLRAGDRLLSFVRSLPEDPQKGEFMRRLSAGEVRLTFSSELEEPDPEVTFVHVRHPLVRGIVSYYRERRHELHPVARVRIVASRGVPAGEYLYVIARLTIFGARFRENEAKMLLPVVVNLRSFEPLDSEPSEVVLGEMVRRGSNGDYPVAGAEVLTRAYEVAWQTVATRCEALKAEAARMNEQMVNLRLESVRRSYRAKIERRDELLARAKERGLDPKYIRMLEGTIRNLEAERDRKCEEIEKLRSVTADFVVIAAGFLEVVEGGMT